MSVQHLSETLPSTLLAVHPDMELLDLRIILHLIFFFNNCHTIFCNGHASSHSYQQCTNASDYLLLPSACYFWGPYGGQGLLDLRTRSGQRRQVHFYGEEN